MSPSSKSRAGEPRAWALFVVLVFAALLAPGAARAEAAWHYLVVEVDDAGRIEPIFHQRVRLAAPRESLSETQAKARTRLREPRDVVNLELRVGRARVFRDAVPFERFVRIEAEGADGTLVR